MQDIRHLPEAGSRGDPTLHRWAEYTGALGLLAYGVGLLSGAAFIAIGQGLMLLGALALLPVIWRPLLGDPLFRLSLVFMVYVTAYTLLLDHGSAEPGIDHVKGLKSYLRLGFLPALLLAFWWARLISRGRAAWPLWAFIAGFYIRVATQWPVEDWSNGIPTKISFGLYYNAFGMYCALVMAWWLIVFLDLKARARRPAALVAIAAAFAIPFLGWLYSLSRGAMLAFLAALPLILFLALRRPKSPRKHGRAGAAVILMVLAAGLVLLGGPVADRFTREQGDLAAFLEQGAANYAPERISSIGTRLVIWREAARLWLDRPVLGYGPGPTKRLIDPLRTEYRIDDAFDFESSYVELLIRLGLAGALFYALHLWLCLRSFSGGSRAGWYPPGTAHFLLAALVIFGIAVAFREGLLDFRGRNYATFLLAGLYSFHAARLWPERLAPPTAQK